ncbi:MAG: 50S ribosomal protein L28 [Spartobacteria bacterium]
MKNAAPGDSTESAFDHGLGCAFNNQSVRAGRRCPLQRVRHVLVRSWGIAGHAGVEESLDHSGLRRQLTPLPARLMSKVCSITGSKPTRGSVIHRRGMAKKKGGVGRHVTKNVPRTFNPNLREQRIWVAELKKFVRVKVTARGLKTINKNGAYATLKKAGLIAA